MGLYREQVLGKSLRNGSKKGVKSIDLHNILYFSRQLQEGNITYSTKITFLGVGYD
jgi:hypothetical protein